MCCRAALTLPHCTCFRLFRDLGAPVLHVGCCFVVDALCASNPLNVTLLMGDTVLCHGGQPSCLADLPFSPALHQPASLTGASRYWVWLQFTPQSSKMHLERRHSMGGRGTPWWFPVVTADVDLNPFLTDLRRQASCELARAARTHDLHSADYHRPSCAPLHSPLFYQGRWGGQPRN